MTTVDDESVDPIWPEDLRRMGMREVLLRAHMQGARHAHLPIVNYGRKIGRNDRCPCGSGVKYKKCCIDRKE